MLANSVQADKSSEYINKLLQSLKVYSKEEINKIVEAAGYAAKAHAGQQRDSGEPYIIHPIYVSEILSKMHMDHETIIAALLHDLVEDTNIGLEDIREKFGDTVARLVEGVTNIPFPRQYSKNKQSIENIRKILIASIDDARIILIKLADKLHNIYTIASKPPDRQKAIAREILYIYVPLADQLGIELLKTKLEDSAFQVLYPRSYNRVKKQLTIGEEEAYKILNGIGKQIKDIALKQDIEINFEARRKNTYSIFQKLQHRSLYQIYDFFGIRLICKNKKECYLLLGLVHATWLPLEGRFKDYIALPKANRYQSLHTTVMGPKGQPIEFQIRSKDMHTTAEYGVAAHWSYKYKRPYREFQVIQKIGQLEKLHNHELLDEVKREILQDSIYVFTPKGDIISLPYGSTARDFAYHIHTDIGHHATSAYADGVLIPMHTPLKNTQTIQIEIDSKTEPKLEWLRHCFTTRARTKIRTWFNDHKKNVFIDQQLIIKTNSENFVTNTNIRLAGCCNPSIGDPIVAFRSESRGIVVHREKCRNLKYIPNLAEKSVSVEWEDSHEPVIMKLYAFFPVHTNNVLQLIEHAAVKEQVSLQSLTMEKDEETIKFTLALSATNKSQFYTFARELRAIHGSKTIILPSEPSV